MTRCGDRCGHARGETHPHARRWRATPWGRPRRVKCEAQVRWGPGKGARSGEGAARARVDVQICVRRLQPLPAVAPRAPCQRSRTRTPGSVAPPLPRPPGLLQPGGQISFRVHVCEEVSPCCSRNLAPEKQRELRLFVSPHSQAERHCCPRHHPFHEETGPRAVSGWRPWADSGAVGGDEPSCRGRQ